MKRKAIINTETHYVSPEIISTEITVENGFATSTGSDTEMLFGIDPFDDGEEF